MNQSEIFSHLRLGYLARRDILTNWKQVLIAASAISGTGIFLSLVNCFFSNPNDLYFTGYFNTILFPAGFIISSMMFRDMHNRSKNHEWLMIPCSTFEKLLSRWIISSIGFALVSLALFWVTSVLSMGVNELTLGKHHGIFNPFVPGIWVKVGHYMILQSIFLKGASFFRKQHFIKTILALIVILLVISILSTLSFQFIFSNYFDSGFFSRWSFGNDLSIHDSNLNGCYHTISLVIKVFYFGLLAPMCWAFTYYRLKGVEVKDGV